MDDPASHSVITVFRSRLRPDATANGYAELAARMESRVRAMPGFIDFKTFTAPDGERVSIITFDTWDHHRAWREDPEHRIAQRRGRRDFYAEYSIFVCEQRHHHDFRLPSTHWPERVACRDRRREITRREIHPLDELPTRY